MFLAAFDKQFVHFEGMCLYVHDGSGGRLLTIKLCKPFPTSTVVCV